MFQPPRSISPTPPGSCMTPSSVTNSDTTIFLMFGSPSTLSQLLVCTLSVQAVQQPAQGKARRNPDEKCCQELVLQAIHSNRLAALHHAVAIACHFGRRDLGCRHIVDRRDLSAATERAAYRRWTQGSHLDAAAAHFLDQRLRERQDVMFAGKVHTHQRAR